MKNVFKNAVIRLTPEQRQAVDPCGCYKGAPYCDIVLNIAQEKSIAGGFIDKLRISSPDTHRSIWLSLTKGEVSSVPFLLMELRKALKKMILENTSMDVLDVSPPVKITSTVGFRYEIRNLDKQMQGKYLCEIRLIMDTNPAFQQFVTVWGVRKIVPRFEGNSNILVLMVA